MIVLQVGSSCNQCGSLLKQKLNMLVPLKTFDPQVDAKHTWLLRLVTQERVSLENRRPAPKSANRKPAYHPSNGPFKSNSQRKNAAEHVEMHSFITKIQLPLNHPFASGTGSLIQSLRLRCIQNSSELRPQQSTFLRAKPGILRDATPFTSTDLTSQFYTIYLPF